MLNRTNRKLSAKNFGLNLGTRSLAVKAGANLGNLTRHAAGRLDSVRVGAVDVRESVWLDRIMLRSYPPIAMRMPMPTGSSPQPQPSDRRGCGEGPSGRIAALASLRLASLLHPRASHQAHLPTQPQPSLTLGQGQVMRTATASLARLPRTQVPDAMP